MKKEEPTELKKFVETLTPEQKQRMYNYILGINENEEAIKSGHSTKRLSKRSNK